jgi:hypothetical protein
MSWRGRALPDVQFERARRGAADAGWLQNRGRRGRLAALKKTLQHGDQAEMKEATN